MRTVRGLGSMLVLLAFIATPAVARSEVIAAAATSAPPAAATPKKTYTLRARPTVGQRIAYEQSMDSTLRISADGGGNRRGESTEQWHDQTVVACEQIIEIGKPPAMSKMVTFGPQCWSATKTNDREPRKVGSIYAGKTVLFRIFEDGTLEQDFGVKPTKAQQKRLKNMFVASADLYPDRPVAVGERWRADQAMSALLDLSKDDTSSTIFTLKEVRTAENGREIAVVGVSAAVIKQHERGFNVEMSLEGSWQIDVASGAELKIDLTGKCAVAPIPPKGKNARAVPSNVRVTGDGTFEMHRAGRLLGVDITSPPTPPETPPDSAAAVN